MKILILNGPNLHRLGSREPELYGNMPMERWLDEELRGHYPQLNILYSQSNHEGDLIDLLYAAADDPECIGVALNAGAYTHTSLALADAIRAISIPVVEVHITNIFAREPERHRSLLSAACRGVIAGFGLESYRLAIEALLPGQ